MDLLQALAELKSAALERIAEAARKGDAERVRALADLVGQIEGDIKTAREVEARRVRFARELTGARPDWDAPAGVGPRPRPVAVPTPGSKPGPGAPRPAHQPPRTASRTALADDLEAAELAAEEVLEADSADVVLLEADPRATLVEKAAAAGVSLTPLSRTLYRTDAGRAVAVPFANEVRAGRWLLSVEDMRYDLVALLCQPAEGALRALVLPWRVLEPVWKGLSRNGRQVKLTVARKPDGWWLQVPGTGGIALDPYLDAYARLGEAPPPPGPLASPVSL